MANTIIIKHGNGKPTVLQPNELGFDTTNKVLYIGTSGEALPLNNTGGALKLPLSLTQGGTGTTDPTSLFKHILAKDGGVDKTILDLAHGGTGLSATSKNNLLFQISDGFIEKTKIVTIDGLSIKGPVFLDGVAYHRPYIAGDSEVFYLQTAGYVSNAGKDIRFIIPLDRPCIAKNIDIGYRLTSEEYKASLATIISDMGMQPLPTDSAGKYKGGLLLRAENKYLNGSGYSSGTGYVAIDKSTVTKTAKILGTKSQATAEAVAANKFSIITSTPSGVLCNLRLDIPEGTPNPTTTYNNAPVAVEMFGKLIFS